MEGAAAGREERIALAMTGKIPFESRFFHYRGGIPIHYQAGGHGPVPLVFPRGFASAPSPNSMLPWKVRRARYNPGRISRLLQNPTVRHSSISARTHLKNRGFINSSPGRHLTFPCLISDMMK
jgi:hypothetical protein